jgi:hypothetical protein
MPKRFLSVNGAGVEDGEVDAAPDRLDPLRRREHRLAIRHVECHDQDLGTALSPAGGQRLEPFGAAGADGDAGSLRRERRYERLADARARAGEPHTCAAEVHQNLTRSSATSGR